MPTIFLKRALNLEKLSLSESFYMLSSWSRTWQFTSKFFFFHQIPRLFSVMSVVLIDGFFSQSIMEEFAVKQTIKTIILAWLVFLKLFRLQNLNLRLSFQEKITFTFKKKIYFHFKWTCYEQKRKDCFCSLLKLSQFKGSSWKDKTYAESRNFYLAIQSFFYHMTCFNIRILQGWDKGK